MTILERNVIHVVLYLITTFIFSSLLLFIAGLEFFGLIFIAIYVGAIAIFFLFLVMCLDLSIKVHSYTFTLFHFFLLSLFCLSLFSYLYNISPYINLLMSKSKQLLLTTNGDSFFKLVSFLYEQNYFYLVYFGWFFLVILVGISLIFRK
jgi:NADH:ubiquinone oxidoreductase subunit 6 (subunit J)